MSGTPEYTPPKVWTNKPALGRFANINRSNLGRNVRERNCRSAAILSNSILWGTPNGVKVTVMLEELLARLRRGAEYDAWLIRINDGDQFGSGFVAVNPVPRFLALLDRGGPKPIRVFETGAILKIYLAEKFGAFFADGGRSSGRRLSWLFWQMGSTPYVGGGFWPFLRLCANQNRPYAIDRFTMQRRSGCSRRAR